MLALVCSQPPRLDPSRAEPVRPPGEVLLGLRVGGICDTDLQLARGYMGYQGVLGHEFVAEVLDADDASLRGRRVVADINASCDRCDACRRGDGHHCPNRSVLGILGRDGALAERFLVPAHTLVPVPDEVPDERAVFAEPLAAALHVLPDLPAEDCVVLGDGKLGLLIAAAIAQSGRRVRVVGHHEHKLALARAFGADAVLEKDLQSAPVAAVVEATGTSGGLARALAMLRPRGTLVLKTTVAGASDVDLSPIVINELRVIGSRCGDLARAIEVLRTLDPTPLIAARYPLAEAERAFAHAATKGTLKVLVSSRG